MPALCTLVAGGRPARGGVHCAAPLPYYPSHLPAILSRRGPLPVRHPSNGAPIVPGTIYVAPPDQHLLVCRGHVELSYGPKENHSRPAIDVLFRSAAESYGPRVIGVVLSGTQSDGSLGVQATAAYGGVTLVQEPQEAAFAAMPRAALRATRVDHILPLAQIPALLADLAQAHDQTERSERMDDPPPPPPLQAARDAAVQRAVQGGISA